jgi:hypothetical protein
MTHEADPEPVVALVRDLMFVSKITAVARAAGVRVRVVRDVSGLAGAEGRFVVADLSHPGAIEAAVAWSRATGKPTLGFVSHVDTETIDRARSAGIEQVVARGAVERHLESLLNSG